MAPTVQRTGTNAAQPVQRSKGVRTAGARRVAGQCVVCATRRAVAKVEGAVKMCGQQLQQQYNVSQTTQSHAVASVGNAAARLAAALRDVW